MNLKKHCPTVVPWRPSLPSISRKKKFPCQSVLFPLGWTRRCPRFVSTKTISKPRKDHRSLVCFKVRADTAIVDELHRQISSWTLDHAGPPPKKVHVRIFLYRVCIIYTVHIHIFFQTKMDRKGFIYPIQSQNTQLPNRSTYWVVIFSSLSSAETTRLGWFSGWVCPGVVGQSLSLCLVKLVLLKHLLGWKRLAASTTNHH